MAHNVGQVISTLRKEKGWTQLELAEKVGVTDKAVSKWETGSGMPDTSLFPIIAELFGVTTDYLHTGIEKDGEKASNLPEPPANPTAQLTDEDMDRIISSCVQDGVVSIDKLVETRNYTLIKRAFDLGYIHPFEIEYHNKVEIPCKLYDEQNWRELFRYCVDMGYDSLAGEALRHNEGRNGFDRYIQNYADKVEYTKSINDKYIDECKDVWNKCKKERRGYYYEILGSERKRCLVLCKQQILHDISLKWDKETTIGGLTKEYFEAELEKGNVEMVIIKLCKRLEAILKSDYHYDGDLNTMMDKYFWEHGREEDRWGEDIVDCEFVPILRKLKKQQESIVGSEKSNEMMTDTDIRYCIEYICKMG